MVRNGKPKKRAQPKRRARRGYPGIQQGVGRAVGRAFGSAGFGGLSCLDAFHPSHLALPRAVAPYTVIRTTQIISSNHALLLFGPMRGDNYATEPEGTGQWRNSCAFSLQLPSSSLGTSFTRHVFESMGPTNSSWNAAATTPAAFSVQVMNPEALQTTKGVVYAGRAKNRLRLEQMPPTSTVGQLANNLVSYSNPRLMSAGKLALRGVHIDAVPNSMADLATFTNSHQENSGSIAGVTNLHEHFEGFNPLWVYNPDEIDLQYLVCCEWRVRFDPSNPAYAACVPRAPSTESHWAGVMGTMESMGNGVQDIAEKVAQAGQAAKSIFRVGKEFAAVGRAAAPYLV